MTGRPRPGPPAASRLARYHARTDRPLLAFGALYIAVYATLVLATDLPPAAHDLLTGATWGIWALFAADLAARVWLAENRAQYLLTHPVDVLVVVLPALRPLRVLRVFSAAQALVTRGGRVAFLRSTEAVAAAAALLMLIAALAVLDAERGAADASITTFPDALWWAATTVTTVGYGDTFPVTGTGRLVAAALMLVGISLVGVVTATVAAWFISQTQEQEQAADADLSARLTAIEAALAELRELAVRRTDDPPSR